MKCKAFAIGLFTLTIAVQTTPQRTIAQVGSLNCQTGQLVKRLDNRTLICKSENPIVPLSDEIYLERYASNGRAELVIRMYANLVNNLRDVHIFEYYTHCEHIKECDASKGRTMFVLKGREFLRWDWFPNRTMLERHRKDVSDLLDSQNIKSF